MDLCGFLSCWHVALWQMFNDVELTLDVVSCVQMAIKLRGKYRKKVHTTPCSLSIP